MDQLISYGFREEAGVLVYETPLMDKQFSMKVAIMEDGTVSSEIMELETGETYILHLVKEAAGSFVGSIREEHRNILQDISEKCFEPDVFQSDYARQIISFIRQVYGDELEFLWKRFSDNAVWRRKSTNKWYGVLLIVSKRKLGIDSDDLIEIIDLRMKPEELAAIIDNKYFFPGYHMNKKHWCTICLDGSVPFEEIKKRIGDSYNLAIK